MSSRSVIVVGFAALALGLAATTMAACVGDDPTPAITAADSGNDGSTPPALTTNGQGCKTGTECQSGQCADGVCCESACSGTCERCNLAGNLGKCAPVPDGEDPDKECPTTPLVDDSDAGMTAPDGGDGGVDAAVEDAGPQFNFPDGGAIVNDNQCAGHCNGKRACAYAGKEVSCGTTFCGNDSQEGRATCDTKGHCLYGISECTAYKCSNGQPGCKAACSSPNDCLNTHFCDGATSTCKKKLDNGVFCATPDQCNSGVCDTTGSTTGICCNIDCSTTPGGTCRKTGSAGVCQCNACPSGPCALYYRDEDGDGFGDMAGTVVNGRAQYGCEAGPAPGGFVKDNTDCFDSASPIAASVRPNQTNWFTAPYTNASGVQTHDYNCSGTPEKETWEGPCGFCKNLVIGPVFPGPGAVPPPESSQPEGFCLVQSFSSTCGSTSANAGRYCSCGAQNPPSFNTAVGCGASGSAFTCNKCAAVGGTATTTFHSSITQRCH